MEVETWDMVLISVLSDGVGKRTGLGVSNVIGKQQRPWIIVLGTARYTNLYTCLG